jgi:hypothetical protein
MTTVAYSGRARALIWIKAVFRPAAMLQQNQFEGTLMAWDANHIRWAEQVAILWALLPPVFVLAALSAFAAPVLRKRERQQSSRTAIQPILQPSSADSQV